MISSREAEGEGEATSRIVTQLNFDDVLLGRGAPAIDNEGNVRFRKIVQSRRAEYFSLPRRQDKDRVARQIVSTVTSRGGRFLKKVDDPEQAQALGMADGATAWVEADDETVLTKVKQALRDRSSEDNEPQPRKRKRVRSGNLVPEDESSESGRQAEYKMESVEPAASSLSTVGRLLLQPNSSTVANLARNQIVSGDLGLGRAMIGGDVPSEGRGHLDSLLRHIQQLDTHQRSQITGFHRSDNVLQLPATPAEIFADLRTGSYMRDRQTAGLPASLSNQQQEAVSPFAHRSQLRADPLLGPLPDLSLALNERDRISSFLAGLNSSLPVHQQDSQFTSSSTMKSCQEILLGGFFKSLVSQTHSLRASLYEVRLLFVLCDHGLPLCPQSTRLAASPSSTTTSTISSLGLDWTWEMMAQKILYTSVRAANNPASFSDLAALGGTDASEVDRATALAGAFVRNVDEFGRATVMLLEKMKRMVVGIQYPARPSSMGVSGLTQSYTDVTGRDSFTRDSNARLNGYAGTVVATAWASQLGVATDGGLPAALSAEDFQGPNTISWLVASYDAQRCYTIFSMVSALTRLRHILVHHHSGLVLAALSAFPDRSVPLNRTAWWWVDSDVGQRDLWLIKTAIDKGVSAVVDSEASQIRAPARTLRYSAITTFQVESRLQKLAVFLHDHFESMSVERIKEERAAAVRALLG